MLRVSDKLLLKRSVGFNTEQEMINFIKDGEVETRAGVSFKMDTTQNQLEVGLHFYTREPWYQNELWTYPRIGIKDYDLAIGSRSPNEPGYYVRGFIYLQATISDALLANKLPKTKIFLGRMPVHSFVYDRWITDLFTLTLGFVAIFYFTFQRGILVNLIFVHIRNR